MPFCDGVGVTAASNWWGPSITKMNSQLLKLSADGNLLTLKEEGRDINCDAWVCRYNVSSATSGSLLHFKFVQRKSGDQSSKVRLQEISARIELD